MQTDSSQAEQPVVIVPAEVSVTLLRKMLAEARDVLLEGHHQLVRERKTAELSCRWVHSCVELVREQNALIADERFGWAVERDMLSTWARSGHDNP